MNSRTVSLSVVAIAALALLFASGPMVSGHQALAVIIVHGHYGGYFPHYHYGYYGHYHYHGHGHYYGHGPYGGHFYHRPHGSFYHGPHGGYAYRYHY